MWDDSTNRDALKARILAYPRWFHSFQLDETAKITGWAEQEHAYPETGFAEKSFSYYHLPQTWRDKTVLDIGGWDGAISFEMERRGAQEVVLVNPRTLDDLDLPVQGESSRENVERKYQQNSYPLDNIHSGGATLLIRWFQSKVKLIDSSIYDVRDKFHRTFDLVLCLGLLYHLRDPVRGLQIAAHLTGEMLILETLCFQPGDPLARVPKSYCEYLGCDAGHNWWRFNYRALEHMLYSCGFHRIERKETWNDRCVYHAFK